MNQILRGARLHVPITAVSNPAEFLDTLKFKNPTATASSRFGGRFKKKVDPHINLYTLKDKYVLVPRNVDRSYFVSPIEETQSIKPVSTEIVSSIKLLDFQEALVQNEIIPYLNQGNYDVNLVIPCGHGKTILALHLIALYQERTIVHVTTLKLAKQWIARATQFLSSGVSIGVFNPDKPEKYDIAVTTYSMASGNRVPMSTYRDNFSHAVYDEVHRIGAGTYFSILDKAETLRRTTLTATFRRADKAETMIALHCGKTFTVVNQNDTALVIPVDTEVVINTKDYILYDRSSTPLANLAVYDMVKVRTPDAEFLARLVSKEPNGEVLKNGRRTKTYKAVLMDTDGKTHHINSSSAVKMYKQLGVSLVEVESAILNNPNRTADVVELLRVLYKKGRNILVLSKRKNVLFELNAKLSSELDCRVLISDKAKEYTEYLKDINTTAQENADYCDTTARIILGIDKLVQEGLDIARLDTIVSLTGIKDIEQAVGRVTRKLPNKKRPVFIYLIDNYAIAHNTWKKARAQFKELKHTVVEEFTLKSLTQELK